MQMRPKLPSSSKCLEVEMKEVHNFNDKRWLTLLRIANIQNEERKRLDKMYCESFQGYSAVF